MEARRQIKGEGCRTKGKRNGRERKSEREDPLKTKKGPMFPLKDGQEASQLELPGQENNWR